jgi:hypothetical protein
VRTGMHLVGVGPDSEPWGAGVAVPA